MISRSPRPSLKKSFFWFMTSYSLLVSSKPLYLTSDQRLESTESSVSVSLGKSLVKSLVTIPTLLSNRPSSTHEGSSTQYSDNIVLPSVLPFQEFEVSCPDIEQLASQLSLKFTRADSNADVGDNDKDLETDDLKRKLRRAVHESELKQCKSCLCNAQIETETQQPNSKDEPHIWCDSAISAQRCEEYYGCLCIRRTEKAESPSDVRKEKFDLAGAEESAVRERKISLRTSEGSQREPSMHAMEKGASLISYKAGTTMAMTKRVVPPSFFYDGTLEVDCPTTADLVSFYTASLNNHAGPLPEDLPTTLRNFWASIGQVPENQARTTFRRQLSRRLFDCRHCICDPHTGHMVHTNSLLAPAGTANDYCRSENVVDECIKWFLCYCNQRLGQPRPQPGVLLGEYQAALNGISDYVKNINPTYQWGGTLPNLRWTSDTNGAGSSEQYSVSGPSDGVIWDWSRVAVGPLLLGSSIISDYGSSGSRKISSSPRPLNKRDIAPRTNIYYAPGDHFRVQCQPLGPLIAHLYEVQTPKIGGVNHVDFDNLPPGIDPVDYVFEKIQMCEQCLCTDIGAMVPNPNSECESWLEVEECISWWFCYCFIEVRQPPLDGSHSLQQFVDDFLKLPKTVLLANQDKVMEIPGGNYISADGLLENNHRNLLKGPDTSEIRLPNLFQKYGVTALLGLAAVATQPRRKPSLSSLLGVAQGYSKRSVSLGSGICETHEETAGHPLISADRVKIECLDPGIVVDIMMSEEGTESPIIDHYRRLFWMHLPSRYGQGMEAVKTFLEEKLALCERCHCTKEGSIVPDSASQCKSDVEASLCTEWRLCSCASAEITNRDESKLDRILSKAILADQELFTQYKQEESSRPKNSVSSWDNRYSHSLLASNERFHLCGPDFPEIEASKSDA